MEMPGIGTAVLLGLVSMSPFLLLGAPSANGVDARNAKRVAIQTEINYRCAQPNVIEVTRYTGLGMKVHKCK